MSERSGSTTGVTDPSAQAGDVKQTTWAELDEMVRGGRVHEAVRIRGEQLGLQPVPLHAEDNNRLFYSIGQSDTTGSELGWHLASHVSGHAHGPLSYIGRAETQLGHQLGTYQEMQEAARDPQNVTRGAASRQAREIYEEARNQRDMADVREVGHFSTHGSGIAARTETGDYLIGFDTPKTRRTLEEAGYTQTDPDHEMGVPFSNNQDQNRQIREALGER